VLRYALQSVLIQDYQNWEMTRDRGDCCTDDTESSGSWILKDPRFLFNLGSNSGQSKGKALPIGTKKK